MNCGLIEEIVPEPLGGAHQNTAEMAAIVKDTITCAISTELLRPADRANCSKRAISAIAPSGFERLTMSPSRQHG